MFLSDHDFVRHIRDEVLFIQENTNGKSQAQVFEDPILERAIIRSLEIIGEASKKLEKDFKEKYNDVEWKKISGTRDRLIHNYFAIDYDIVWDIIEQKIPELKALIDKILAELENEED